MNATTFRAYLLSVLVAMAIAFVCTLLGSCSPIGDDNSSPNGQGGLDTSRFVVAVDDEPDTVDFQCTSLYYTVANNVFNRLVETVADTDGTVRIEPSLAQSWDVSDGGRVYTFHLRDDVAFSNGNTLTSSDVLYSFTRLLTHPDSCNRDIVIEIAGAKQLANGETDQLEGFKMLGDHDFQITLEQPFEAFLPSLSMAGASILDEQTTKLAGNRFGTQVDYMVGTGPFILREWKPGEGMLLVANPACFAGAPRCEGLDLRFVKEPEEARALFEQGELDILDLDDVPDYAEYYVHGDIYQEHLYKVQRVALTYIALNESIEPLDDVRVRKALQLALDRPTLLDAVYSGRGAIENGIFPRGLTGYNPDLPDIAYDPAKARELLEEAGYPDGFDLVIAMRSSSTQSEVVLSRLIASMWEEVGVHASVTIMDESEFMRLRKAGNLACYSAMWTADYDDPDNFIYTFFGTSGNSTSRSICYQNDGVMDRVRAARAITDPKKRLQEYNALEQAIVQDDAAWIPLFSRQHIYVMSERVEGVPALWNGSVKSRYCELAIRDVS